MSDYSTLRVGVSADTSQVSREVREAATEAGRVIGNILNREFGQAATNGAKLMVGAVQKGSSGFGKAFTGAYGAIGKGLAQMGSLVGQATLKTADLTAKALGGATIAATAFGVAAFQTAARVGEMDATLRALAKGDEAVYAAMQKTVGEVRHQGIEAGVAQNLVAQFTRSELDLTKATDLATVAQNSAVIAGRNSTEVLDDLVHGIMTQNSMVLRNAGINVQAGQAVADYAAKVGKSTKDLTDAERAQAVLNAVIAAGAPIAGAYAAAMEEPGKVLRSFPRVFDDIKATVGQGLVEAFGPMILKAYELAKAFSASLQPGGSLRPLLEGIMAAIKNLAQPLAGVIEHFTAWVKNVKPGAFKPILDAIKDFAPLLASAATGLATFAGGGVLQNIPVLGNLLGNLGGPLGSIVSGIGMLVATSPELRKEFAGLIAGLKPMFSAFMGLAAGLAKQLVPIVKMLLPVISNLVTSFAPLIATVFQVAGTLVQALLPAIQPLLPVIEEMAFILADTLQGALMQLTPAFVTVADMIGGVIKAVAPLLAPLMALAGILIDLAVKAIVPLIPPLVALIQAVLPPLVELFSSLLQPVMALVEGLIPIVSSAAQVAGELIGLATKALVPLIGPITAIVEALAPVAKMFADLAGQAIGLLMKALMPLVPVLLNLAQQLFPMVADIVTGLVPILGDLAGQIFQLLVRALMPLVPLFVDLARMVLPMVAALLKMIVPLWVQLFKALMPVVPVVVKLIATLIQLGVGALRQLLPPLMELARKIFPLVLQAVGSLIPVAVAFVRALLPILPVVAGLIQQLVRLALRAIMPLLPLVMNLVQALLPPLLGLFSAITPVLMMLIRALTPIITLAVQLAATIVQLVVDALGPLIPVITNLITQVVTLAVRALMPILPLFMTLVRQLLPPLLQLFMALTPVLVLLVRALTPIITLAVQLAAVIIRLALGALTPLISIVLQVAGLFIRIIAGAIKPLITALGSLIRWIVGGSPGLIPAFNDLWNVVKRVWEAIRAAITWAWENVIRPAFDAIKQAAGWVGDKFQALRKVISDAIDAVKNTIDSGFATARRLVEGAVNNIRDTVNKLAGFFRTAATDAINALKTAITNTLGNVADFCERVIVGPLRNGVRTVVGFFTTAGTDAIHGLFDGIKKALGNVKNWVEKNIFNPIKNAVVDTFKLGSPSKVMEDMGRNVMAGFVKGVLVGAPVKLAKTLFGSLPEALGAFVTKGFVAIADLPAKAISAISSAGKAIAGAIGGLFGLTGTNLTPGGGGAVNRWRPLMAQVLAGFGRMDLMENFMRQLASESGGNPNAINLWDSNAKKGIPSKGLMQVIDPTFAAYAGPFKSRSIWDPLANIFAGVAYALKRYGARVAAVIGHGHGYALGGIISEPVVGIGMRSGDPYRFGERGVEVVTPLRGGLGGSGYNLGPLGRFGRAGGVTVNVYPQPGQSELDIAAAVQRRLAWAEAAGAA